MENPFRKRLLSRLASFENKSDDWEWVDLQSWLQAVDTITKQYQGEGFDRDTLLTFSKRLSQCMTPQLPTSLHSKALEIYKIVLSHSTTNDFYLFSSGFLPFFEHASSQNKHIFLEILNENFISNIRTINNIIPGIVFSLLGGAEDRPEIFLKIKDSLDEISKTCKKSVQRGVWSAVQISEAHRHPGLKYIKTSLEVGLLDELAVDTLILAFQDESVFVKRLALDIVNEYYGIASGISDTQKGRLVQEALKLLRFRDFTLIRRVWDLASPESTHNREYILQLVCAAMERIIKEYGELVKSDELKKLELIQIMELAMMNEIIGSDVLKQLGISYVTCVMFSKIYLIDGKYDKRAVFMLCGGKASIFWGVFTDFLSDNLIANEMIGVLMFAVKYIEIDSDQALGILDILLKSLPTLYKNNEISELCRELLSRVDTYPRDGSKLVIKLFNCISLSQNEYMLVLSEIIAKLSELGLDIRKIIGKVAALANLSDEEFLTQQRILAIFKYKGIKIDTISTIWGYVGSNYTSIAIALLVDIEKLLPYTWSEVHVKHLCNSDPKVRLKAVEQFSTFCSYTNEEVLGKCLVDPRVIFLLIELLNDHDPFIKYTISKWLVLTKSKLKCVFDPIISLLLHTDSQRYEEGGQFTYKTSFDMKPIIHAIDVIRRIIEIEPNYINWLELSSVNENLKEALAFHSISGSNYLSIVISVLLVYSQTISSYQEEENKEIQLSAISCIQSFILIIPSDFACTVFEELSKCLLQACLDSNIPKQSILLETLAEIIYDSKLTANYRIWPALFENEDFSRSLLNGLYVTEDNLLCTWIKFISDLLPALLQFLPSAVFIHYIETLQDAYLSLLVTLKRKELLKGLTCLLHSSMGITAITRSCVLKDVRYIASCILKEVESVLRVLVDCFDLVTYYHDIKLLLSPIAQEFTKQFIHQVLEIWVHSCLYTSSTEEKDYKLMSVIICADINVLELLEDIFMRISVILANSQKKGTKLDGQELCISHFLYTFLLQYRENNITIQEDGFWRKVLKILGLLYESAWEESFAMCINILYVLSSSNFSFHSLEDSILQKKTRTYLEQLTEKACDAMLRVNRPCYTMIFPKCARDSSASDVILLSLENNIVEILYFYMENPKAILDGLVDSILTSTSKPGDHSISLVREILHKSDLKGIAKRFLDFLCGPTFELIDQKNCAIWMEIIDKLSLNYTIKLEFIDEIIEKFNSSLFTSSSQARLLLKQLLLTLSLTVLASATDHYTTCSIAFLEKLQEGLQSPDSVPYSLLLLKSLLTRSTVNSFLPILHDIWPSLLQHPLSKRQDFIQFLLATNYEYIYYAAFLDSSQEPLNPEFFSVPLELELIHLANFSYK